MASIVKSNALMRLVRPLLADDPNITNTVLKDVNLFYSNTNIGSSFSNQILVYGSDAINNMIDNIFMTTPGERDYEPTFGSRLPYLVWDPIDRVTAWRMETATYDAIAQWLSSYITLLKRQCSVVPLDSQDGFFVTMRYVENITNSPASYASRLYRPG